MWRHSAELYHPRRFCEDGKHVDLFSNTQLDRGARQKRSGLPRYCIAWQQLYTDCVAEREELAELLDVVSGHSPVRRDERNLPDQSGDIAKHVSAR